jgi:hypothetical protein
MRVASGDEALLEDGRVFSERLNPGRGYGLVTGWVLKVEGKDARLEPGHPLSRPRNWITTIVLMLVILGFSILLGHDYRITSAMGACLLAVYWGKACVSYFRDKRHGPWLIINARNNTVSLPRFNAEFPLSDLQLVIAQPNLKFQGTTMRPRTPLYCDLDAVVESSGKIVRFSMVGEIGDDSMKKACQRLEQLYGVSVLRRTRRDGQMA